MIELLRRHVVSISFLAIFLVFVFLSRDGEGDIQQLSGYTMGTTYELQIVDMPEGIAPEQIAAEVTALLAELDTGIFSTYAADSELSRFNRHAVDVPFTASRQLLEVLQLAQSVAVLSNGAFDVTVGPLVNAWGFGPPVDNQDGIQDGIQSTVPTQSRIDELLATVGYQNLEIIPARSEIRKTKPSYVDLSGIAKGYAVDQVAAYFDGLGVANYFLEIGGELKIKGTKPGGVNWVPAMEAPIDGESRVYEIFSNRGETIGVAGSGDYRNFFEADGIRYSHEIDPHTGRPISHNLAAVYVIAAETALADALATAFMVLGNDAGAELAERENLAVYFIYKTADAGFADYISSEFSRFLEP